MQEGTNAPETLTPSALRWGPRRRVGGRASVSRVLPAFMALHEGDGEFKGLSFISYAFGGSGGVSPSSLGGFETFLKNVSALRLSPSRTESTSP